MKKRELIYGGVKATHLKNNHWKFSIAGKELKVSPNIHDFISELIIDAVEQVKLSNTVLRILYEATGKLKKADEDFSKKNLPKSKPQVSKKPRFWSNDQNHNSTF